MIDLCVLVRDMDSVPRVFIYLLEARKNDTPRTHGGPIASPTCHVLYHTGEIRHHHCGCTWTGQARPDLLGLIWSPSLLCLDLGQMDCPDR